MQKERKPFLKYQRIIGWGVFDIPKKCIHFIFCMQMHNIKNLSVASIYFGLGS